MLLAEQGQPVFAPQVVYFAAGEGEADGAGEAVGAGVAAGAADPDVDGAGLAAVAACGCAPGLIQQA